MLPEALLAEIRERAAVYDRENRFFDEDLAALRERGYLRLLVPQELGGLGATLAEAGRVQRRLAAAAPATALAMNMHLVVTGAALHAHRRGHEGVRPILEDAAQDRLFAFGISEAGNEAMLFDASTEARRLDEAPRSAGTAPAGRRGGAAGGGVVFSGTKIFTSLAPAWDRLVVHGRLAATVETDPTLVFGVLERTEAVRTLDDWDTHGMRASQSRTTILDQAPCPAEQVITTTPVGPNQDPFVLGVFGCFELLIAAVYTGIAQRAVELGTQVALRRRSITRGIVHADDPDVRRRLARAAIGVDGSVLQIDKLLADLDALGTGEAGPGTTDHGGRWFLQFSGVKSRATEAAIAAVDEVLRASGGAHYSRRSELERLSRDARAGIYHPSDEESVQASYAKALLGEIGAAGSGA
ncbi:acyl-CoA dehydrogenase family protein [Brachybacterium phenoliresistens]|uniref:acyl-CoA dehydrogenase family protein n=1 Tax=Brachybacterium phenoliresistens TaxID=396014 RepID=UPI0005713244|nr:acyl-CoA dehydrogenase family protein [Brachybacterium phenoliresistens]